MFSAGDIMGDIFNTGSISAFPTAPAANVATDMQVQAGTSAPVGTNLSGGAGPTNSTVGSDSKANLRWSAGIVIAALILLWFLGAIVFKGVGS